MHKSFNNVVQIFLNSFSFLEKDFSLSIFFYFYILYLTSFAFKVVVKYFLNISFQFFQ